MAGNSKPPRGQAELHALPDEESQHEQDNRIHTATNALSHLRGEKNHQGVNGDVGARPEPNEGPDERDPGEEE